jgi:NAD(P)-dependent dehydrogenase (short-subunit alcohol dehydrogenase family)
MSELAETRIQMRRVGLDTVVAGAVASLRSDEASYMTGAHLAVGGGFLVRGWYCQD